MWIERLNEVFEKFRKYKNCSINPELNTLRDELSEWVDFIIDKRTFIPGIGEKIKHSDTSITEIEGFNLNDLKLDFNRKIAMWLEDKPPYENVNANGKTMPEYKPYAECKNNDERFKVVLNFFDWVIKVHKIKVRLIGGK